jgi:DNA-binding NarL/FixJ family response regulator
MAQPNGAHRRWPRPPELLNRHRERQVLDQLVRAIRGGQSQALAISGEPGVGKTALLDYLAEHAPGCRVERTVGIESEMEFPFAGVHQLCAPVLDRLDRIPEPQGDALRTTFGMNAGSPPDRFLLALAVLSLLSEAAADEPFISVVDDYQWLDIASALILSFVARRLGSESVALVFGTRSLNSRLIGLPELVVHGLSRADAYALLDSVVPGKLEDRVRDQIVVETRGNPLALLELTGDLTAASLAVGFELPGAIPLEGRIEESYRRRVSALPEETRRLLLIAAADSSGDLALVWRAATLLGISPGAAAPAAEAGLAEFSTRFGFRHPLVRTAVYGSATAADRRAVHRALADATDPGIYPERRAWHRAQASPGPDDDIAAELEQAADSALARGCLATAGAYLQKAANLSTDPVTRRYRALAAARGKIRAGSFGEAVDLLSVADSGSPDEFEQAQVDQVLAQLASATDRGNDVAPLLLKAATKLEQVDPALSRATYLEAFSAAVFAGRLAKQGGGVLEVSRLAGAVTGREKDHDWIGSLLGGFVAAATGDYGTGLPMLRSALGDVEERSSPQEELRWLWLISLAAMRTWDDERWNVLSGRYVDLARELGALSDLPLALVSRSCYLLFTGAQSTAMSMNDETQAVNEAIGSNLAPYGALGFAALRGDESETLSIVETTIEDVTRRGEGLGVTFAEWARALLYNGLGRYDVALEAGLRAVSYEPDAGAALWPATEVIEAAVRTGNTDLAIDRAARVAEMTGASGTNWARGIQERSLALVSADDGAEEHYRQSIASLAQTTIRTDLARAHLLYGEWLRRRRRTIEARAELRSAFRMCEDMGMNAFAERARNELRAAGETIRRGTRAIPNTELTAQELQIARLARDGLTNPEIATRLFISAHTVQYHLRKVFAKSGIASRTQLDRVLPG